MAKVYKNIDEVNSFQQRGFFFDTNVLIFLYNSNSRYKNTAYYSALHKKLLETESEIIVDSTVISEYINRSLRIEFDNYKSRLTDKVTYKEFRDSEIGQKKTEDVYYVVNIFLSQFNVVNTIVADLDFESVLQVDKLDFNDKIIKHICSTNNYILVTDDSDYKEHEIEILTNNKALFNVK